MAFNPRSWAKVVPRIIHRGASSANRLLGRDTAGRNFEVFADDSFIVSYPRSGSTWLRFLVGNLIARNEPICFRNVERVIPDVHVNSMRYINGITRPRLLKSHEYFDPRYQRVVYLVRDPRDVAVSYYRYHRKVRVLADDYPMQRFVATFLMGEPTPWGSWAENVASWLSMRQATDDFLLLRYEDLLDNPIQELSKTAIFLGIQSTVQELARSVELSSAEKMRALEISEGDQWLTIKGSRKEIPFVGAAISGSWKMVLEHDAVSAIEFAWGDLMKQLGYALSICSGKVQPRQQSLGFGDSA